MNLENEDRIVIATEELVPKDMSLREQEIYKVAYKRGVKEGELIYSFVNKVIGIGIGIAIGLLIIVICNTPNL